MLDLRWKLRVQEVLEVLLLSIKMNKHQKINNFIDHTITMLEQITGTDSKDTANINDVRITKILQNLTEIQCLSTSKYYNPIYPFEIEQNITYCNRCRELDSQLT